MHVPGLKFYFSFALITSALFFGVWDVYAQEEQADIVTNVPATLISDKAPYVLTFDHLSRTTELHSSTGTLLESWPNDFAPIAVLPPGRPLVVKIRNANSLLYNYSLNASVVRTKRLQTCSNLGKSASTLGNLQNIMGMQGSGLSPFEIVRDIVLLGPAADEELYDRSGDDNVSMSELTLTRTMNNISSPLDSYANLLEQIEGLAESLPTRMREIAVRAEIEPIDPMLAGLQSDIESSHRGFSDPDRLPTIVLDAQEEFSIPLGSLSLIGKALDQGDYAGEMTDAIVIEVRALEARVERAEAEIDDAVSSLQLLLKEIQVARSKSEQHFNLSASDTAVRQLSLQLTSTDNYATIHRLRSGTVLFYSEPRANLLCHLSVGIAFLDEPPVYESVDGVVSRSGGSDSRVGVNVLLHVASGGFPIVGGLVGIGLGDGNSPDFYAGGSLRMLNPLMINLGAVWQRAPRLPGGVHVGDTVGDPFLNDDLTKRYRPEFFFGISFTR